MASYKLSLGEIVPKIIPRVLRSPRMHQWMLAITFPLQKINNDFVLFAEQTRVFAEMSSQTLILETFLNDSFSKYFPNPDTDRISIMHGVEVARATYEFDETPPSNPPYETGHLIVYGRNETPPASKESPSVFHDYENNGSLPEDFRLALPVSIQTNENIVSEILAVVDRYVIDTKKYDVVYG